MNTTRNRIERLEAQTAGQNDPIASGRYAYQMRVAVPPPNDGERITYTAWDVSTGQHVPMTAALRASIERSEADARKRGICRDIQVRMIGSTNG